VVVWGPLVPACLSPGLNEKAVVRLCHLTPPHGCAHWFSYVVFPHVFVSAGLVNMLNAGGALQSVSKAPSSNPGRDAALARSPAFSVQVRGLGQLLAHCSTPPRTVVLGGKPLPFAYDKDTQLCSVELAEESESLLANVTYAF
jgi:hypothetical protein